MGTCSLFFCGHQVLHLVRPLPRQVQGTCKIFYMGTRGSQALPASKNEGFLWFFWHSDRDIRRGAVKAACCVAPLMGAASHVLSLFLAGLFFLFDTKYKIMYNTILYLYVCYFVSFFGLLNSWSGLRALFFSSFSSFDSKYCV